MNQRLIPFMMFDHYYRKLVLFGLVSIVWFATFAKAAHDLWAATIVFLLTTALLIIFGIGRIRDGRPIYAPLWLPSIILLLILWCSTTHSFDVDSTLLENWGWTFALLIFYLFINAIDQDLDKDQFFKYAGMVVVPLAAICIWQQGTGQPVGFSQLNIPLDWIRPGIRFTYAYGHWEIPGTLINSIVLAGFVLYWPLAFWKKKKSGRMQLIGLIASLLVLLLARSWLASFSLVIGFIYLYAHEFRKWLSTHKTLAVLMGIVFILFTSCLIAFKVYNGHEGSYWATSRIYHWITAYRVWRYNPWVGTGLGSLRVAYPYYKVGMAESTCYAHNWFLQILSETGVLGAFGLCVWLAYYFHMRLCSRSLSDTCNSIRVYDSTLIAVLCFSQFTFNMEYLLNKIVFLMFLVPALTSLRGSSYHFKPLWIGVFLAGWLSLSPFWLSLFTASRSYATGLAYELQGNTTRAIHYYQNAISLDNYQADSYWGLSRIYKATYQKSRSSEDLENAILNLENAIRYKKDARYVTEMERYKTASH